MTIFTPPINPSYGEFQRVMRTVRLPLELDQFINATVEREGLSRNETICQMLTYARSVIEQEQQPEPEPKRRSRKAASS